MARQKRLLLVGLMLAALVAAACSPEAGRRRGGGPGADVGNRWMADEVDLHGRTDPYFKTPNVLRATRT